jgi:hypothetical protein
VNSHLVHAIFYHGEAVRRRVSRGIHFVRRCFINVFNWSSSASRAATL